MLIFFFFLHQLCLRLIFTTNPSLWLLATPLYSNNLTPITPQTYGTEGVVLGALLLSTVNVFLLQPGILATTVKWLVVHVATESSFTVQRPVDNRRTTQAYIFRMKPSPRAISCAF